MDILFQTILTLTSLLIFILLSAVVLEEVLPKWGRIKADRLWNALLLGIFLDMTLVVAFFLQYVWSYQ